MQVFMGHLYDFVRIKDNALHIPSGMPSYSFSMPSWLEILLARVFKVVHSSCNPPHLENPRRII